MTRYPNTVVFGTMWTYLCSTNTRVQQKIKVDLNMLSLYRPLLSCKILSILATYFLLNVDIVG